MTEVTLYELEIPGKLLGKLVVDRRGRILGVAFAVRIEIPPGRCMLLVKGKQTLEVPLSEVEVGPNLRLRSEIDAPEIDLVRASEILESLKAEIRLMIDSSDFDL